MNKLDSAQIATLRERLARREADLRAEIDAARGSVETEADAMADHEVSDQKDEAATRQLSGMADAQLERDLAEMSAVQGAKRRMADGQYGVCIDCASAIDFQRLLAQPEAARCAQCQRQREHESARAMRR